MHPFSIDYAGHLFTGMFDYEPAEPATDLDPAIPAIATIVIIGLNGVDLDVYEHINPATIQALEALIIQDMAA
jgi:hypothetical protein